MNLRQSAFPHSKQEQIWLDCSYADRNPFARFRALVCLAFVQLLKLEVMSPRLSKMMPSPRSRDDAVDWERDGRLQENSATHEVGLGSRTHSVRLRLN